MWTAMAPLERRPCGRPVHPHVRGDGLQVGKGSPPVTTSPPRAWGRREAETWRCGYRRFTPTCVGTAGHRSARASTSPVHPHVRGDGGRQRLGGVVIDGSPPRAWGRRGTGPRGLPRRRFTPTCVGTAVIDFMSRLAKAVHPHVRGDGQLRGDMVVLCAGSPPRAWGRLPKLLRVALECRFTPTCVGTANHWQSSSLRAAVHPHVRGDGSVGHAGYRCPVGSPPRAWGRRLKHGGVFAVGRFTPTCVGTASAPSHRAPDSSVHPHVRGDGCYWLATITIILGSPPRAWGRPPPRPSVPMLFRFTPTCVGTARSITSSFPM